MALRKEAKEFICETCGKKIYSVGPIAKYCSNECRDHRLKIKKCPICGKEFKATRYKTYCSDNCAVKGKKETTQNTLLKRYGVTNVFYLQEIKDKVKETVFKKYGVDHVMKVKAIKEKAQKTTFKHYGVYSSLKDDGIKDKIKQTIVNKYGVDNPMKNTNIKMKAYSTILKKYGVKYITQNEKIKNKIKETCLERYGIPCFCVSDKCNNYKKMSKHEDNFAKDFLKGFEYTRQFNIYDRQYDFKIGDVLIELNPFPFHNTTFNPLGKNCITNTYHYNKTLLAKEKGYRCIHIFDWDNPEKVIMLLDQNKTKIYARKCDIIQLTYEEGNQFLEKYHLQNGTKKNKNDIYLGLIYEGKLIMVMSFGKPRYNKHYEWEILRLCTHKDYSIIGGASKIFKRFLEITNTSSVISYCDMSKFDGNVYKQLGFELYKWNMPSKHRLYIGNNKDNKLIHITDNYLRQRGFDQTVGQYFGKFGKGTSNDELMKQFDYVEIYDCGQATFIWNKYKKTGN